MNSCIIKHKKLKNTGIKPLGTPVINSLNNTYEVLNSNLLVSNFNVTQKIWLMLWWTTFISGPPWTSDISNMNFTKFNSRLKVYII
jgi:hypothetical protein